MQDPSLDLKKQQTTQQGDDVAIIGMACLFPGAPNLTAYWHNILHKVDAISDPPPESWDPEIFYDPKSTDNDRVYCKRGGFIGSMTSFEPLDNGVMPLAVQGSEPDQWLALKIARDAMRDAGYGEDIPERERTAVIIGKGTYLNRGNLTAVQHGQVAEQTIEILKTLHPELSPQDLARVKEDLKRNLPPFNADTASGLIPNVIAGRIANRLNLMGPSYTVDAACASSLIAMEMALHELASGRCDLALVGGAHVVTPVPVLMLFCQLGALSRQEQIRPFDKSADGTILGEGIGMMVLKRLTDALRDGNRVYAVVKGAGSASDGRGLSVMAPRMEGEVMALRRAYEHTGISPRSVGLIEAHGTGTPVGDVTEVRSLAEVFGPRMGEGPSCALGSVKSMIGHVMPAAGVAGIIKTALSLYHGVLPPTVNVDEPNPQLQLDRTPFYLNTETRPWIHRSHETPRRAGVNAFGFGGINAHVILEEPPRSSTEGFQSRQTRWDSEVFILSAISREEMVQHGHRLTSYLAVQGQVDLKDLAYTLNASIDGRPSRLAIVATDANDLREKLALALQKLSDPATKRIKDRRGIYYFDERLADEGQVAFLFPGEGSQYVNMLSDLAIHFPLVREHFDAIDRVFAGHARNFVPSDFIFPPPSFSDAGHEAAAARIWQMEGAVESVLTASRALHALLRRLEIKPDAVVGHSTGEYSAMLAAGMIQLDDEGAIARFSLELNAIYQDAAATGEIPLATLVAVGGSAEAVQSALAGLEGDIYVALDNCPHQTVIVGDAATVDSATALLVRQGLICERLSFDRPYHTPLFQAYSAKLRPFLERWLLMPAASKAYSCTTTRPFSDGLQEIRQVALDHWLQPVAFRKTIEAMHADGVRIFVEVGPSGNLTAFVDDILHGQPHLAVPVDVINQPGIGQLNHLVGLLAAHGVPMALDYLYNHRQPRRLRWDSRTQEQDAAGSTAHTMKLLTGWPPMSLSQEMATSLRAQLVPAAPTSWGDQGRNGLVVQTGQNGKSLPAIPAPAPAADGPGEVTKTASNGTLQPMPAPARPAPAMSSAASQVMSSHFQTMQRFLAVETEVMQAFLAGRPAGPGEPAMPAGQQAAVPVSDPGIAPGPSQLEATPAPAVPETEADVVVEAPAAPVPLTSEAIREVLLRLVSERTGYPVEMLNPDVDLEANLGIDSIKRVEILGSFQRETGLVRPEDMEALASRKTLGSVLAFLTETAHEPAARVTTGGQGNPSPSSELSDGSASLPFISRVLALDPEEEFRAIYEVDLGRDAFLRDHTLGRQVSSTDPALTGLPVMPLTVSLEMLAEAASVLAPGQRLVGMREIRAYRWITVEHGRVTLELRARRGPDGTILAEIREGPTSAGEGDKEALPIVEANMLFAADYPPPPLAEPLILEDERPSTWTSERLYSEGMFHGPAFRGVASMDSWGSNGCLASLAVLPLDGAFGRERSSLLQTDPILLDQPGQVVAFWMAEHLDKGYVIFPFRVEALHLYGPPPISGQQATCQARIELVGDWQVRSDLDVLLADGRLWCRFQGWWDRRFDLPEAFFRLLVSPEDADSSRTWPEILGAMPDGQAGELRRLGIGDFPDSFFTAHTGIWRQVMSHLILSRRERQLWHSLSSPEHRRLEWLLGRMAAKDAVRAIMRRHSLQLRPADVEVLPDASGRPVVQGPWDNSIATPWVSISHARGNVVAIALPGPAVLGVGIDLEIVGRMSRDVEEATLTASERALIADLPAGEAWPLRLWCAKEAAGKAVGQGMAGGPQALPVDQVDPKTGRAKVSLKGQLAQRLEAETQARLTVFTARDGDKIVAIAAAPAIQRDSTP